MDATRAEGLEHRKFAASLRIDLMAARKQKASSRTSDTPPKKGASKPSRNTTGSKQAGPKKAPAKPETAGKKPGSRKKPGPTGARAPLSRLLERLAEELPEAVEGPVREIKKHVANLESQLAEAKRRRGELWEGQQEKILGDLSKLLEDVRGFVADPASGLQFRRKDGRDTKRSGGRTKGAGRRRSAAPVGGHVEPGFEAVADAFQRNFDRRGDHGAALSVYLDGKPVVDLWGGHRDVAKQLAWQEDTLVLVYSATKGLTATCIHRLVEQGRLDLDEPVASYWPEFGQAGKAEIPIWWILTHQAGLPVVEADLTTGEVLAWNPVVEAIAAQAPIWEPGKHHGYHPRTFGWILGELVRRVTGRSLGQFFAEQVARPLGLDFYIGLGAEHEHRVAELLAPSPPSNAIARKAQQAFMGPNTQLGRALTGPGELAYGPIWNSREMHAAEIPSSNGIGTARALARHYASLIGEVDGIRLLGAETVERARQVAVKGRDKLIQIPTRFGLGYMLPPSLATACGSESFGHPGAGGSLAFADPEARLALGFVVNRMELGLTGDARSGSVVSATYDCL